MIPIGFDGYINSHRILFVLPVESRQVESLIEEARHDGRLIDGTADHKCKSVIILDTRQVILSARSAQTVAGRIRAARANLRVPFDQSTESQLKGAG